MSDIETTLWSSLLRESSKKFKVPQAACVVIGDVDVGKRKLVDNMCNSNKLSNNQLNMNANDIKTDIVSYNYLDYEEYDNDTSVSKIHIWTLGLQTFDKAFEPVATTELVILFYNAYCYFAIIRFYFLLGNGCKVIIRI